ncbi:hypothetical protein [Streptomyces manipurensis]|uniref:hypothetical protein n=1 Tax=Streptomyces manipurensis TaxID=1077945 RepID=UPI003C70429E
MINATVPKAIPIVLSAERLPDPASRALPAAEFGVPEEELRRAVALARRLRRQEQLAGWAAYDAGNYDEARGHYTTASAASRAAEDSSLEGNSLAFQAYLEWTVGGGSGIRFATAAYEALGSGTAPVVRALPAGRLAWQQATWGNAREADSALGIAEEAIHEHADEPGPDWAYLVDSDEITIMTGRCRAELHRPLLPRPLGPRIRHDPLPPR